MIHGDRSQSQRTAALAGFQQGRYRVLVATDVASRGIHVQDIAHVINYDLPEIAENFIHRVGRTGRAGEERRRFHAFRPRSALRPAATRAHAGNPDGKNAGRGHFAHQDGNAPSPKRTASNPRP